MMSLKNFVSTGDFDCSSSLITSFEGPSLFASSHLLTYSLSGFISVLIGCLRLTGSSAYCLSADMGVGVSLASGI